MLDKHFDVFISYESTTGTSYAENLKKALEKARYSCFLAGLDINIGIKWEREINSALENCKYFVIIITSLTMKSEWVIREYEKAMNLRKRIIPCRWKNIEVSETKKLKALQQIEFEDKYELANKVINEIQRIEKEKIKIENDPIEFLNRGNLFYTLKEFEKAEKEYRKALRINPNLLDAHNNLGVLLSELKRYDEAEKEYSEALRINPNFAGAHNNLGLLFAELKRYEEAEKEYREALRINPNDAGAHNNLGNLFAKLKRYEEAEKEYREAIRINPNYAGAYYNLACLYSLRNDLENAIEYLKKAIEIDENYKEMAKQDKDFDNIKDTKEFREIIQGIFN